MSSIASPRSQTSSAATLGSAMANQQSAGRGMLVGDMFNSETDDNGCDSMLDDAAQSVGENKIEN
jgi:hypothetical protein